MSKKEWIRGLGKITKEWIGGLGKNYFLCIAPNF